MPVSKGISEQNQKLSSAKKKHKNDAVLHFLRRGRILRISCTASCHVPAESIVRLGLSIVAYSAFNDTLRRQLDPANDRPRRAQLMHPLACLCQHSRAKACGNIPIFESCDATASAEMKIRYKITLQEVTLLMDEPGNEPYRWT
jgi:hypothetical protein